MFDDDITSPDKARPTLCLTCKFSGESKVRVLSTSFQYLVWRCMGRHKEHNDGFFRAKSCKGYKQRKDCVGEYCV
jgi:hypothetical protein